LAEFSVKIETFHPMPPKTVDIKEIKQLIDLMKRYGLTEFELEEQAFKIRLRREADTAGNGGKHSTNVPFLVETPLGLGAGSLSSAQPASGTGASNQPFPVSAPTPPVFPGPAVPIADEPGVQIIKSPMVGTFYRSPNPEAKAFVEAGSPVQPDTVICIIEAMKLMNEIHAEVKGTITECLAESGKPIEFGQPLFKVKVG
jgi:acetyl-CoA carboxylase biotin carboxyl carrier protein